MRTNALDIVICDEEDVEAWAEGEDDDDDEGEEECPLPPGYWSKTGVIECSEKSFVAEEEGRYVLLLVNWDDEATEVTVDAAVWGKAEE